MSGGTRLIAESELRALWRVSDETLRAWRKAGIIASDVQQSIHMPAFGRPSHFYWDTSLDVFLREHAFGFGKRPIPTITMLLENPRLLVPAAEAMKLLDVSPTVFSRLMQAERFAYIRPSR